MQDAGFPLVSVPAEAHPCDQQSILQVNFGRDIGNGEITINRIFHRLLLGWAWYVGIDYQLIAQLISKGNENYEGLFLLPSGSMFLFMDSGQAAAWYGNS